MVTRRVFNVQQGGFELFWGDYNHSVKRYLVWGHVVELKDVMSELDIIHVVLDLSANVSPSPVLEPLDEGYSLGLEVVKNRAKRATYPFLDLFKDIGVCPLSDTLGDLYSHGVGLMVKCGLFA
jgi:hypothetical protein